VHVINFYVFYESHQAIVNRLSNDKKYLIQKFNCLKNYRTKTEGSFVLIVEANVVVVVIGDETLLELEEASARFLANVELLEGAEIDAPALGGAVFRLLLICILETAIVVNFVDAVVVFRVVDAVVVFRVVDAFSVVDVALVFTVVGAKFVSVGVFKDVDVFVNVIADIEVAVSVCKGSIALLIEVAVSVCKGSIALLGSEIAVS